LIGTSRIGTGRFRAMSKRNLTCTAPPRPKVRNVSGFGELEEFAEEGEVDVGGGLGVGEKGSGAALELLLEDAQRGQALLRRREVVDAWHGAIGRHLATRHSAALVIAAAAVSQRPHRVVLALVRDPVV
jgi:hypothetical protein